MDDLTILEIIHLANVGMASHNFRSNIPTNIAAHNQFIPSEHLKTQNYLEDIDKWTEENKMKLNERKTTNMLFNFTKDFQFTTDIKLKNVNLETNSQTKLLGAIITNDLKWHENTKYIVKRANQKMIILHKFAKFTNNKSHLLHLFKSQVRGILEYCSTVWHSSLTETDSNDIERVQKAAMRLIMGNRYQGYKEALKHMSLDSLKDRREKMALRFIQKSLKQESFSRLFPLNLNHHLMRKRNPEKYSVNIAKTERYRKSAVPFLQRLLNDDYAKQKKNLKCLLQVNIDVF